MTVYLFGDLGAIAMALSETEENVSLHWRQIALLHASRYPAKNLPTVSSEKQSSD